VDDAGWLRTSIEVVIDARRGGAGRQSVPLAVLRCPQRCLACDNEQFGTKRVFVGYRASRTRSIFIRPRFI